jgi:hypothetical protein
MKPTKFGDYEKLLTFPVFASYYVNIVFTNSLQKSYDARFIDPHDCSSAKAMSVTVPGKPTGFVFLLRTATPGVISHESCHAIRAMLECVGVAIDDEVFAYHVEFLVEAILAFKKKLPAARSRP